MNKIFDEIRAERERQDIKFGVCDYSDYHFLAILMEETGEVAQAVVQTSTGGPHAGRTREEIVHAVAVGVSWLEAIDRRTLAAGPERGGEDAEGR